MFGNLPMQIRMACPYLLLVNVVIWTSLIEESIKSLSKISSSFFSLSRKSASVQQRRHRNLSKYLAKVSSDERVVVSNLNRHTSINVDNQPIVHLNFNYEGINTANHTEAKAKVGGEGSVPSIHPSFHPAISVYACLLMLRAKKYEVPQVKI